MTWFTESPTPVYLAGVVALVVLGVLFLKSGRGVVLLAMAAVALAMGLAALVDRVVITDREAVELLLYEAAALAEQNDFEELISRFVSPAAVHVQDQGRRWAEHVSVVDAYVLGLQIDLHEAAHPPAATARFQVAGKGEYRDRGGAYPSAFKEHLTVKLAKEGERWLVTDIERR